MARECLQPAPPTSLVFRHHLKPGGGGASLQGQETEHLRRFWFGQELKAYGVAQRDEAIAVVMARF